MLEDEEEIREGRSGGQEGGGRERKRGGGGGNQFNRLKEFMSQSHIVMIIAISLKCLSLGLLWHYNAFGLI